MNPKPVEEPVSDGTLQASRSPSAGKALLYLVIIAVIVFIAASVLWFAQCISESYTWANLSAESAYRNGHLAPATALEAVLAFSRARDAALVKGGALLLCFIVVALGALIVLEGTKAVYSLSLKQGARKSALETSSPGLVMITLGLSLAYGVMLHDSTIDLSLGGASGAGPSERTSPPPLDPTHEPPPPPP
ncbi:hypothetical protein POL68_15170 [Stigmatella sp. ncwal1]|uniref:Uncharacterized protein n=1 Tax=Stigmatella ashevillensis TaxID=2995309 RepID=A0ABT5D813_9BACT|nr:hypothetical protein [Stigmatella ashevillena]MDC0709812.1 hypothetical protein [Stigmatella ashevillena]